MALVKVSPKFQVVIPREVRQSLGIRAGQRLQVLAYDGRLQFVPVRPMKQMRGFLKGIDSRVWRDANRQ